MNHMFSECTNFDKDINNSGCICIENMDNMFQKCKHFNKPLNNWDISNVVESMD